MNTNEFSAVILAAGSGTRMNANINKVFMEVGEKPLLYYSLKAFSDAGCGELIVVIKENERQKALDIIDTFGFAGIDVKVIAGGDTRAESSYKGACEASKPYVLIHDAARAFVTTDIIKRCMEGCLAYDACIAAMPVKDTIKVAETNGSGDVSRIADTPDRSILWQAQTPQAFSTELIKKAYKNAFENGTAATLTDDAQAVEKSGVPVYLVKGSYTNIKITEESDLVLANTLVGNR